MEDDEDLKVLRKDLRIPIRRKKKLKYNFYSPVLRNTLVIKFKANLQDLWVFKENIFAHY